MAGSSTSTLFVNQTGNVVNMKVGNNRSSAPIASIAGGGQFRMPVNMNDTYREFLVGVGSDAGKTVIVTSDDCCDYQCITIKEIADGTINLLREPRHQQQTYGTVKLDQMTSPAAKKPWFACIGLRMKAALDDLTSKRSRIPYGIIGQRSSTVD